MDTKQAPNGDMDTMDLNMIPTKMIPNTQAQDGDMDLMMLTSQELLDKILAKFAEGKRVVTKSYTKPVIYDKRHASMFRACTNGDRGVRIGWPGKRSVYATEEMLAFER